VPYLGVAALVWLRRPWRAAGMVAPYAAGLVAASVQTGRTLDRPGDRVFVPAAFVAMHVGWGVGVWSRVRDVLIGRASW